ncbi:MAG: copper amine oxidase N-terminal domain-containing protein [Firmicutes bacterium]|nr:copper amine oxidase N-terminal domain-containing protein [Bacillota bacterium]
MTFIMVNVSSVFAATEIKVIVDNKDVVFTDAKPQIINSRTMVPIRVAAEALGMTVEWDKPSETATFKKGNDVITHKMNSSSVTVNGAVKNFDYKSVNVSNRILMPIRMLAEATGAAVEWDSQKSTVIITSLSNPLITSFSTKKSEAYKAKDDVEAIAGANEDTTKVKVTDASGTVVGEFTKYTVNSDDNSRSFEVGWTLPDNVSSDAVYKVYAGDEKGYSDNAREVKIRIEEDTTPKIVKASVDDNKPAKGDKIKFTVRTNDKATKIKIESDYLDSKKTIDSFEKDGNEKVFTYQVKMSTKGSYDFDIFVGDDDGFAKGCETITVNVGNTSSKKDDDDNDEDELEIYDIVVNSDTVSYGEDAIVNVHTSTDVEMVEIYDSDDKRVAKASSTRDKSSSEYIWELSFTVRHSGSEKYKVVIKNDDDDEEKESFKIEGEKYSSSDLYIINFTSKSSNMSVGDTAKFTVKTTEVAKKVVVKDSSGDELDSSESTSSKGKWDVSFKLTNSIANKGVQVYAYDKDNNVISRKFYLSFDEEEDPEITDVEIEEDEVDYRDDIEIKVYTNKAVKKVWVEDSDEERVAKTSKYETKKNEYVWSLSFEAEETGKCSYIVYAENDDDDTDEYKIKVTVTK